MKKMVCHSGCLCCVCKYQNENINKKFYDIVVCYQEEDKCVEIVPMKNVLREMNE